MHIIQREISLGPFHRGFHLITREIERNLPDLKSFSIGICHLLLKHTSASLTLNENADPSVRADFEAHFNIMIPDDAAYFVHTLEGMDDMPAHIKSSLLGATLSVPVSNGNFNLGRWQGIYLCEHRDRSGIRQIVATVFGK